MRAPGPLLIALAALLGTAPARGADGRADQPARLMQRANLDYPAAALQDRSHGTIVLTVEVDDEGRVSEAAVLSGPTVFRQTAIESAYTLIFTPAVRDGAPCPSTVQVTFHYEPPGPMDDGADDFVVVHGESEPRPTAPTSILEGDALADQQGLDLGETIGDMVGVTAAGGGARVFKPIIRGQTERRLLLINDDLVHAGQSWGADHAPEVDSRSASRITIIQGAGAVRYGPQAVGGAIVVEPEPLLQEPGATGSLHSSAASNGRVVGGGGRLDWAPASVPNVALRINGNATSAADFQTPTYTLGNTAQRRANLGASAEWSKAGRRVQLSASHHGFEGGIFAGMRAATPADLVQASTALQPPGADEWTVNRTIERPYQRVSHDQGAVRLTLPMREHTEFHSSYSFQRNHRREYDTARESVVGPQVDLLLRTHNVEARVQDHRTGAGGAETEGQVGIQLALQENVYSGVPLIPNARTWRAGFFGAQSWSWPHTIVDAGVRFDATSRTAFLAPRAFEAHIRRGALDAQQCSETDVAAQCSDSRLTSTASLGARWQPAGDALELGLSLGRASRVPTLDELYLNGAAPSSPTYVVGDPGLGVETTWSMSPEIIVDRAWLRASVTPHISYSPAYVQRIPKFSAGDGPAIVQTIRGALPLFTTQAVQALFYGTEAHVQLAPNAPVGLGLQGTLVRAHDLDRKSFLVGTPADRIQARVFVRPPEVGGLTKPELVATVRAVDRQRRTLPQAEFVAPPPGFVRLDLAAHTTIAAGPTSVRVGIRAHNLLNQQYRSYTNQLRYFADELGRDVRADVQLQF
ncbi:MAG: TonB family protein [Myxococcota bacterium]